jgi:hypothetical protein
MDIDPPPTKPLQRPTTTYGPLRYTYPQPKEKAVFQRALVRAKASQYHGVELSSFELACDRQAKNAYVEHVLQRNATFVYNNRRKGHPFFKIVDGVGEKISSVQYEVEVRRLAEKGVTEEDRRIATYSQMEVRSLFYTTSLKDNI